MNSTTLCREYIVAVAEYGQQAEATMLYATMLCNTSKPLFCRIHKTPGCRCGNLLQELFDACQFFPGCGVVTRHYSTVSLSAQPYDSQTL